MAFKHFTELAGFAALCLAAPALAAPTPPDAARIAAAQKLLDAMHYDTLIDRTLDAVVAETQRTIAAKLDKGTEQPLPAELVTKIQAIAASHMRNAIGDHRSELRRGTALIYARHFTAEELSRLAAMQSEPAMVKMQAELPQLTAESMALSHGLMESAKAGLEQEVKAALMDYLNHKDDQPPS
jgi:uncharacterized protein